MQPAGVVAAAAFQKAGLFKLSTLPRCNAIHHVQLQLLTAKATGSGRREDKLKQLWSN